MQEDSDFLLCTNTQICEEKKSDYRSFSIEPKQEMTSSSLTELTDGGARNIYPI